MIQIKKQKTIEIMRNHKKQQHSKKLLQWAAQSTEPNSAIQWKTSSKITINQQKQCSTSNTCTIPSLSLSLSQAINNIIISTNRNNIKQQAQKSQQATKQIISNLIIQNSELRKKIYKLEHHIAIARLQFQNKQLQYRNVLHEYKIMIEEMVGCASCTNTNSNINTQSRRNHNINYQNQQSSQYNSNNNNKNRSQSMEMKPKSQSSYQSKDKVHKIQRQQKFKDSQTSIKYQQSWNKRRKWMYQHLQKKDKNISYGYDQQISMLYRNNTRISQSLNRTNSIKISDQQNSRYTNQQQQQQSMYKQNPETKKKLFVLDPNDYLCFDKSKILQPFQQSKYNHDQQQNNEQQHNRNRRGQHLVTLTSATQPIFPSKMSPYLIQYENNPTVNLLRFADDVPNHHKNVIHMINGRNVNGVDVGNCSSNLNINNVQKQTASSSKAQTQRLNVNKQMEKQKQGAPNSHVEIGCAYTCSAEIGNNQYKLITNNRNQKNINISKNRLNIKDDSHDTSNSVDLQDKQFQQRIISRFNNQNEEILGYSSQQFKNIVEKGIKNRQRIQQLLKNCVKIGESWN